MIFSLRPVLWIALSLLLTVPSYGLDPSGDSCSPLKVLSGLFPSEKNNSAQRVQQLVHEFDQSQIQNVLQPEELSKILTLSSNDSKALLGTRYRPRKEIVDRFYSDGKSSGIEKGFFKSEKKSWLKNERPLEEILDAQVAKLNQSTGLKPKQEQQFKFLERYQYELKKGDLNDEEVQKIRNLFIPIRSGMSEEQQVKALSDSLDFITVNTRDQTKVTERYQKFLEEHVLDPQSFGEELKNNFVKNYLGGSHPRIIDSSIALKAMEKEDGAILQKLYSSVYELPGDQKRLSDFLERLHDKPDAKVRNQLKEFYRKIITPDYKERQRIVTQTEKTLRKNYPDTHDELLYRVFIQSDLKKINPIAAAEIIERQGALETRLAEKMKHVLEANAPPAAIHNAPKGWAEFVKEIPANQREEFTYQLLNRYGTTTQRVTAMVSNLEPTEGVRDAVARFLRESRLTQTNRTEFTQDQIRTMFGGDRFKKFFPWMKSNQSNGAIRTQFSVAVNTNPKLPNQSRINLAWVREKFFDNEIGNQMQDFMGFRPALDHERFNTALTRQFKGSNYPVDATKQLRGLVVQGEYEKNGYSLMTANRDRGALQFEAIVPQITRNLEEAITNGFLKDVDPLDQRLFVQNWAFQSTDANLIERIRRNAILVEDLPGFWQIRVDIHNFPTMNELARTKRYLQTFNGNSRSKSILTALVDDLETFLGAGNKTGANLDGVIDKLKLAPANAAYLKQSTNNFDLLNGNQKLEKLQKIRQQFVELKTAGSSATKKTDQILGEKTLSDQAALISNEHLQLIKETGEIADPKKVTEFAGGILSHLEMDHMLDVDQIQTIRKSLKEIQNAKELSPDRKLELTADVLENAVDQVYYKMLNRYGDVDDKLFRINTGNSIAVKFIDSQMRKGPTFILSKLSDEVRTSLSQIKKASFEVNGETLRHPAQIYNAGKATGVLRINKNPLQMTKDEIGVFSEMPTEMSPAAGMITIGTGARLSHVQLLAKSLGLPNAKLSAEYLEKLKKLDGKLVHFVAQKDGSFAIHEVLEDANKVFQKTKKEIHIPDPDHRLKAPISFGEVRESTGASTIAGPKGMNLSKLYQDTGIGNQVPDGFILPFGYFKKYADEAGITPLLDLLAATKFENRNTVVALTNKIQKAIRESKIPDSMLDEAVQAVQSLQKRTGHQKGYFFRSDTHIEDLEGFNAAGLNESVPNVLIDREAIDQAIRRVWESPFSEKSIDWRNLALQRETVTIAEPSVVVMPTVEAASSGVILSKGTDDYLAGKGKISANWGIGSVVESGRPVEEITLETNPIHQSFTVSDSKPVARTGGGLEHRPTTPGLPVLSLKQIEELNRAALQVEKTLGEKPYGYDIEWAFDSRGKLIILQARPNMP